MHKINCAYTYDINKISYTLEGLVNLENAK